MNSVRNLVFSVLFTFVAASLFAFGTEATSTLSDRKSAAIGAAASAAKQEAYLQNKGQWDSEALFLLRRPGLRMWLTREGIVYDLFQTEILPAEEPQPFALPNKVRNGHVVRTSLRGANTVNQVVQANSPGTTRYNWFKNGKTATGVRSYGEVTVQEVLPGIDAQYYMDAGAARYDLIVQPGANPADITWVIEGAKSSRLSANGDLLIETSRGTLSQSAPYTYQNNPDGSKTQVSSSFVLQQEVRNTAVSFQIGNYDPTRPLIIDPLIWSTYLGTGDDEAALGIELYTTVSGGVTTIEDVFTCGYTDAELFPVQTGAYRQTRTGELDAFVARFNADASDLVDCTYHGGSEDDVARDIAVDADGDVYVTGYTTKGTDSLGVTPNAYQTNHRGACDIFVTKFPTDLGSLTYSTLIGGSGDDRAYAIVLDGKKAIVAGSSTSSNFPDVGAVFDNTLNSALPDAVISKVATDGESLEWSTFLGEQAQDIALDVDIDSQGDVIVCGLTGNTNQSSEFKLLNAYDATFNSTSNSNQDDEQFDGFVTKFESDATALIYSTFFGGVKDDYCAGLDLVSDDVVYVVGSTLSDKNTHSFPVLSAYQDDLDGSSDAFVAGFNTSLSGTASLLYSSYLGGVSQDYGHRIQMVADSAFVIGITNSSDFPVNTDSYFRRAIGDEDVFMTKLIVDAGAAGLEYSTYFGGKQTDRRSDQNEDFFAIEPNLGMSHYVNNNHIWICGGTRSTDFPTTVDAYQEDYDGNPRDAFLLNFELTADRLTVLRPVADEEFCTCDSIVVKWERTGNDDVIIHLVDEDFDPEAANPTPTAIIDTVEFDTPVDSLLYKLPEDLDPTVKYSVRVYDAINPALYDSSEFFFVYAPPVIDDGPDDLELCLDDSDAAEFVVDYTSEATHTIQWQERTSTNPDVYSNLIGENSATYDFTAVDADNERVFRVEITNDCGIVTSATVQLIVVREPNILSSVTVSQACEGDPVRMSVDVSFYPAAEVVWQVFPTGGSDWADIPLTLADAVHVNDGTNSYLTPAVSPAIDGNRYRAKFTNACGTVFSDETQINLKYPPRDETQPQPQDECAGDPVTFTWDFDANPDPDVFRWQVSDDNGQTWTEIGPADTRDLTIASATTADETKWYRAVATGHTCWDPADSLISDSVQYKVNLPPTLEDVPTDTTICVGSGVTISFKTNNVTGLPVWRKDGNPISDLNISAGSTSITFLSFTAGQAGVYSYVGSGECEPDASFSFEIFSADDPTIDSQPADQFACEGDDATFTVDSDDADSYEWFEDDGDGTFSRMVGESNADLVLSSVTVAMNGNRYRARARNTCGRSDFSEIVTLTVGTEPSFTRPPSDVEVCANAGSLTVDFGVDGDPTPSISWFWDQGDGDGFEAYLAAANDSSVTFNNISDMGDDRFFIRIANSCGSVDSAPIDITLLAEPSIDTEIDSQTICDGEPVSFTVDYSGAEPTTIIWQERADGAADWSTIVGESSKTYTISSVTTSIDQTSYRAQISNSCGTAESEALLTVISAPQFTNNAPADQAVCEGLDAEFEAVLTNTSSAVDSYQWQVQAGGTGPFVDLNNSADVTGANSLRLTLVGVTTGMHENRYRLLAVNQCADALNPVISREAELTVNFPPRNLTIDNIAPLCDGDALVVQADADSRPEATVQWERLVSGTWVPLAGQTDKELNIASVDTGWDGQKVRAVFTNSACGASDNIESVILVVKEDVSVISSNLPEDHCVGEEIDFEVVLGGSAPFNVVWETNDGGGWIQVETGTEYTRIIQLSDDELQLRVRISNDCATLTPLAITLNIEDPPAITRQPENQEVCEGQDVTFNVIASGTNLTYQWQRQQGLNFQDIVGAVAASYTLTNVQATNDNGAVFRVVVSNSCNVGVNSDAVTLTVNTAPTVDTQPTAEVICEGDNVSFMAAASGSPTPSISWEVNTGSGWSAVSPAVTAETLTLNNANRSLDGNLYRAVFTNTCGSDNSNEVSLTVNYAPENPTISGVEPVVICENTNLQLLAGAGGKETPTVQWQLDDGTGWANITGQTNLQLNILVPDATWNGHKLRAEFTNSCGNVFTDERTLTVLSEVSITQQPTGEEFCVGEDATFTIAVDGATPITIDWQTNSGSGWSSTGTTGDTYIRPIQNINDDGLQVRAVVSNQCGSLDSDVLTLVIKSPPTITSEPVSLEICEDDDATFTVAATGSELVYQWQQLGSLGFEDLTGETNETLTLNTVKKANLDGASFRVIVSNSCEAVNSITVTLTVDVAPVVDSNPADQEACVGESVTFNAAATSRPALQYFYEVNSGSGFGNRTALSSGSLTLNNLTADLDGNRYRFVFVNKCGEVFSNEALLTVNVAPVFTAEPQDETICATGTVKFDAEVAPATQPTATYQWQLDSGSGFGDLADGTDISGATTLELTLTNVTVAMNGNRYRLVATNVCAPAGEESAAATLTVDDVPEITSQPLDQTVCENDNVTFTVSADPSPAIDSYQWQLDLNDGSGFNDIAGANAASLTLTALDAMNGNSYRVIVTNYCGSTTSDPALLTVETIPTIDQQPVSQTICEGETVSFTAVASGRPAPDIVWQVNNGSGWQDISPAITLNTLEFTNVDRALNGNQYRARFTNNCGSLISDAVTLTVNNAPENPVISGTEPIVVCEGTVVILLATADAQETAAVQWQINRGSGWEDLAGQTAEGLNLNVEGADWDGYQLRAEFTNSCGTILTDVRTLDVLSNVSITQQPEGDEFCVGDEVTFNIAVDGSAPITIEWQTNSGGPWVAVGTGTSYTRTIMSDADDGLQVRAVVSNQCGDLNSDVVQLTIKSPPTITSEPQDLEICEGDDAVFTVEAEGSDLEYQWQQQGALDFEDLTGETDKTLTLTNVQQSAFDGALFRVVLSNGCNVVNSQTVTLTVDIAPTIDVDILDQTACSGEDVTFTADAISRLPLSYAYQVDQQDGAGWSAETTLTGNSLTLTDVQADMDGWLYRLVFTNDCGTVTTIAATLTVNVAPTFDVNPVDQTVCAGSSVTFDATLNPGTKPGASLQWQVDDGSGFAALVDGTDVNGVNTLSLTLDNVTLAMAGNLYRLTAENICAVERSLAAELFVDDVPTITSQPQDLIACEGDDITLSVGADSPPALSYQWQRDDGSGFSDISGATAADLNLNNIGANLDGLQYRVRVINYCGETISDPATLTVNTLPSVTAQPVNLTICEGEDAVFVSRADGQPTPDLIWQVNDGSGWQDISPAQTNETLTLTAADRSLNGTQYRARFSNDCGVVFSNAAALTVNYAPTITSQAIDLTVCEGDEVRFAIAVDGDPAPAIQWQVDRQDGNGFVDLAGETAETLILANADPNQDGWTFRAHIDNPCAETFGTPAELTVNTIPSVTLNPLDDEICEGDDARFEATADAQPQPDVQWEIDRNDGNGFVPLTGETGTVLNRASVPATQDGFRLRAVFSNACGQVFSDVVTLIVRQAPSITTEPVDIVTCEGQTVDFTAIADGNPQPDIQWEIDRGAGFVNITGETGTVLSLDNVQPALDGTLYRAIFTNQCGQVSSREVSLRIEESPVITTEPVSQTICKDGTVILTADADGVPEPDVQWQENRGAGWNDISGAEDSNLLINSVDESLDGVLFRAVFSNNCGEIESAAAEITVEVAPSIDEQPIDLTVCEGRDAEFRAIADGTPLPTVQWQAFDGISFVDLSGETNTTLRLDAVPASADGRALRAVFTNSCGSLTSQEVNLTVWTTPEITMQPRDTGACEGGTLELEAAAEGRPAPQVQWQVNDGSGFSDLVGETQPLLTVTNVPASADGFRYRAVFENDCGETSTREVSVRIEYPPVVEREPRDTTICAGEPVELVVAVNGDPQPQIQWLRDDNGTVTEITGANSPTLTITSVPAAWNGQQFRARFSNSCGTLESAAATLTVNTPPTITDDADDLTICENSPAQFSAAATGQPAPSVQWQQSDDGSTWNDISGAVDGVLDLPDDAPAVDQRQYRAVFTNECGTTFGDPAQLIVQTTPVIAQQPTDVVVCDGEDVTISASATASPQPDIRWQQLVNGVWTDLTGETANDLQISNADAAQNGTQYRAVFVNACQVEVVSEVATLTVQTFTVSITENGSEVGDLIDFGEIIRCDAPEGAERSFRLSLDAIGIQNVQLRSQSFTGPFASTLVDNTQINTDNTLDFNISYNPTTDGAASGTMTLVFEPCGITRQIELRALQTAPALTALQADVDFGIVASGDIASQVIEFENSGTAAINIESWDDIAGPFFVVSWIPAGPLPIQLAPGERIQVTIEYRPETQDQTETSTVTATSTDPCLRSASTTLRGESAPPPRARIVAIPQALDFGTVMVTMSNELELVLENRGDKTGRITGLAFDLATTPFRNETALTIPLEIPPNESRLLTISFNPTTVGVFNDSLRFFADDGLVPVVALTGTSIPLPESTTNIIVPDLAAAPNTQNFSVPVILQSQVDLDEVDIQALRVELVFDATLFNPESVSRGRIESNTTQRVLGKLERRIIIEVPSEEFVTVPADGEILTELIGTVLLGESEQTELRIASASWDVGLGTSIVEFTSGSLTLEDVCRVGGTRLIMLNRAFGITSISPNPVGSSTQIITEGIGLGAATLEIFNEAGKRVYLEEWTLTGNNYGHNGNFRIHQIDATELSNGTYHVIFRSRERLDSGRLIIVK